MNADLEQLKAEHAEYLQLVQLKDFMAAVNDLLDKKDAELEALRKIAACFKRSDANNLNNVISAFKEYFHNDMGPYVTDHCEMLSRLQAAAKLAEGRA